MALTSRRAGISGMCRRSTPALRGQRRPRKSSASPVCCRLQRHPLGDISCTSKPRSPRGMTRTTAPFDGFPSFSTLRQAPHGRASLITDVEIQRLPGHFGFDCNAIPQDRFPVVAPASKLCSAAVAGEQSYAPAAACPYSR
jgi:hypothetical protein